MFLRIILVISAFLVLAAALAAIKVGQFKSMGGQSFAPPPEAVTSIAARQDEWYTQIAAVATITARQGVNLSAQTGGLLVEMAVENGAQVKEGEVIARLDTAVEEARLRVIEARLNYARLHLRRIGELVLTSSASVADKDLAEAEVNRAEAEIAEMQAIIQDKIVTAPFSGRLGIRSVNPGQYVNPGQPLISLQRLDRVFVNFSIPQRNLPGLSPGHRVTVKVDAYPGREFVGSLTALDPQVDPHIRHIAVQATVENPDEALLPGMFGEVTVSLPDAHPVVLVPNSAIAYAPYGNSVFVIASETGADQRERPVARQSFVKLGDKRGDLVAVLDGLEAGQTVATSGVFKLRNGLEVQVDNSIPIGADANPKPANL